MAKYRADQWLFKCWSSGRTRPVTFYSIGAYAKSRDKPGRVLPQLAGPELNQLQVMTQSSMNAVHIDQNTVSLGTRWDLHPKMALKAQWDNTWLRKNGGLLLLPGKSMAEIVGL